MSAKEPRFSKSYVYDGEPKEKVTVRVRGIRRLVNRVTKEIIEPGYDKERGLKQEEYRDAMDTHFGFIGSAISAGLPGLKDGDLIILNRGEYIEYYNKMNRYLRRLSL